MANEKRLIYLEDAYEAVTDLSGQAETKSAYAAFWKAGKELEKLPTVDAAPVVHGRWIPSENGGYHCSVCDKRFGFVFDNYYCHNCGAKMDGDGNA